MAYLLPSHPGLLPYWQLIASAISFYNTIQQYRDGKTATLKSYKGPAAASQCTDLNARTFGSWTLLSGVVRAYGAYRIDNPDIYAMVFASYVIVLAHYSIEWGWYGTVRAGKDLGYLTMVSTGTVVWMLVQWGWYLQ
ncbi:ergosterol biosynthesis protein [Lambiella insularis]|nr:ergosterol biosynthesis protein [Lambiella insularis]